MHILSVFFSLLFTSYFVAAAPEGYLESQVDLDTSSFNRFSSVDDGGLSDNLDKLTAGKQRPYIFNNANPEPFLILSENSDCSPPNGNQIPNSKRRTKRQSSDMCKFDSLVRSGPKDKPKSSPSTIGQEEDIEQPSAQPESHASPVTQPMHDRNKCEDDVMNIPVCGSLRNVYLDRAVGPWVLLICHLCK